MKGTKTLTTLGLAGAIVVGTATAASANFAIVDAGHVLLVNGEYKLLSTVKPAPNTVLTRVDIENHIQYGVQVTVKVNRPWPLPDGKKKITIWRNLGSGDHSNGVSTARAYATEFCMPGTHLLRGVATVHAEGHGDSVSATFIGHSTVLTCR